MVEISLLRGWIFKKLQLSWKRKKFIGRVKCRYGGLVLLTLWLEAMHNDYFTA
jgi:hypothetical protein